MSIELTQPFNYLEKPVSLELQNAVEQFYYREAQLLDHRKYQEWLTLLTEDIHYWVPIRTTQTTKNSNLEYYGPGCNAHFDEDHSRLTARIRGRLSGLNWTEDPPSRSRHMITNVIVREVSAEKLEVSSAFLCYRNRLERMTDIYVGERRDILLRANDGLGFKIDKRTVLLDQGTITANNLSMFF
ncbi:3-phenylpropionate/cinnamic acid dioxygenase subunit beta [Azoarcus communis]|jgi:biphenyl 2,3-dioxygenase beta subunit|uniref:Aromatic-ring-hydroxylating dioxygenase subunit beta n=4 Tax=Rhodocyclales TaxID=206389 RepID=A0A848G3I3_9RHOO|nr:MULTISPECIES: aromatic-ring-hydroxylating dioxygenase subunit beta [Rhodocyclales]NTV71029.1 aromatic-ring-hydroxylating dioxygenase subunit beta [Azonexaceae bacterium]BAC05505.1 TodC2 [Thauera sp. DNT-1]NMG17807.1 3-phenylpropionate/cinnamic acid dioxygenase subunit beta [Aromatoleum bremense]NMG49264.1 3-phenylpropionate/cinnamic acid dioxygenase subunit beta [Parazoarcus communis]NML25782.1 aromatic-ring-hydroxylating dioxygenase subunit beta [Zoogloea dura]